MIINQQEQQQREDMYGNEVKRRRITAAGDHLKVWEVRVISYGLNEEIIPAGEEEEATYIVQEPVTVKQEESIPVPVQATPAPVQFIGRTVVIETTGQRIHRGRIQSLFELNGERAIHIETSDGENLIFRVSQMCDLKILHEDEVLSPMSPMSPIPRHEEEGEEVVQIDDNAEVHEVMQRMEVVQVDSESDNDNGSDNSDASCGEDCEECWETRETRRMQLLDQGQEADADDQGQEADDFPFQPARRPNHSEEEEEEEEEEEPNCCAICFDATDAARNFVSLNCGHQFHFACIMGNMANGGNNRNQCPMCRGDVLQEYDVDNLDVRIDEMVENAASHNQRLQDELALTQQRHADLSAEYMRVMSMNMQIGIRHAEEREARDALERRAYICGLNERVATVVSSACNNDVRHNPSAAVHLERQMRELCMCFGMMAYDAQYDQADDHQADDQEHQDYQADESSDDEM